GVPPNCQTYCNGKSIKTLETLVVFITPIRFWLVLKNIMKVIVFLQNWETELFSGYLHII
ncbi:hypothetical protein WUBG_15890, partial [Wuchereria bancrofti]